MLLCGCCFFPRYNRSEMDFESLLTAYPSTTEKLNGFWFCILFCSPSRRPFIVFHCVPGTKTAGIDDSINVHRLASKFFDCRCRKTAGILAVFQGFLAKAGGKFADKMGAGMDSAVPRGSFILIPGISAHGVGRKMGRVSFPP